MTKAVQHVFDSVRIRGATMKTLRLLLSLVAVLLVVSISSLGSASTQTRSMRIPLVFSEFIPCANQGNGEVVDFSGTLHVVISSTVNGNNIHLNMLFNPQGAKGVGETTGDVWQATGETREDLTASVSSFPFTNTFVNNFKLINGRDGSLLVHENSHVTVSADGTTIALHDNFTFTCK
jgi:hypothetical protein